MSKVIGVLGCGWLGLPLARTLVDLGYKVKGTTTSTEKLGTLEKAGIDPYLVTVSETKIEGALTAFLGHVAILIINIPPQLRGKGPKESYVGKVGLLMEQVKDTSVTKVIFISSTSVYGDEQGEVNEKTVPKPTSEAGKQLLESEKLIRGNSWYDATVIRFGGLIGPDRHPVTMLSGRKHLKGGNAPINLIHLDDCIGIITTVIALDGWGELFNAVYPEHPVKREYYAQMAKNRNIKAPEYLEIDNKKHKKILNSSIFLTKNYHFLTPILP